MRKATGAGNGWGLDDERPAASSAKWRWSVVACLTLEMAAPRLQGSSTVPVFKLYRDSSTEKKYFGVLELQRPDYLNPSRSKTARCH